MRSNIKSESYVEVDLTNDRDLGYHCKCEQTVFTNKVVYKKKLRSPKGKP